MAQNISCLKCGSTVRTSVFLRFEYGCSFHELCLKSMTGDHCPAHLVCRNGDQDEAPRPPPAAGSPPPSISGFGIADVFYGTLPLVGRKCRQL
ncbi:hypothetical protein AVEN_70512-1 [Araneus ventricosus]|uniref:Uncharacterized protein n=1 Tax=Araneus ventricosus TaxID=182803 RepID=A0A4Y2QAR1_ARAVE|nr:hypothetical protein AVEN_70512-1 [Araneus ventricosus]